MTTCVVVVVMMIVVVVEVVAQKWGQRPVDAAQAIGKQR